MSAKPLCYTRKEGPKRLYERVNGGSERRRNLSAYIGIVEGGGWMLGLEDKRRRGEEGGWMRMDEVLNAAEGKKEN